MRGQRIADKIASHRCLVSYTLTNTRKGYFSAEPLKSMGSGSKETGGNDICMWGKPKVLPFWGVPLFYKAPPRQFQPPKCKLTPSNMYIGEGRFFVTLYQKLQVGGRQFTSWRATMYILEAEIVLGVLYRKGDAQKGGGTLGSWHCAGKQLSRAIWLSFTRGDGTNT